MSQVNADLDALLTARQNILHAINSIESTMSSMTRSYQQLGGAWSDRKYGELGTTVDECKRALINIRETLTKAEKFITALSKSLLEYEEVNLYGGQSERNQGQGYQSWSSNARAGGVSSRSASTNNLGTPGLTATKQTWKLLDDGTSVFNEPVKTGKMLDSRQGKVDGFRGTCGLVSCENVVRMAGIDVTEQQIVDFAAEHGLCRTGDDNPGNNGGTSPSRRRRILANFGIQSELRPASIESIADAIAEGRGVIVSVDAGLLRNDPNYIGNAHAVTITSVRRNPGRGHAVTITSVRQSPDGEILGFFLCDSGRRGRGPSAYYSASHISAALRPGRPMNVTSIIR